VLPPWCDQHQFRSIVLVTARDHSRRLRRVIDRVLKGHPTRVTVQPSRYSSFDPDRWWKTRSGIRTEIEEFQKLVLTSFCTQCHFDVERCAGIHVRDRQGHSYHVAHRTFFIVDV
jgi:hypothetical protein